MNCPACGRVIPEGGAHCPHCGQAADFRADPAARLEPRARQDEIGQLVGERFELRAVIGAGPLGTVYRAFDQEIEVDVGLKILRAELFETPEQRSAFVAACADVRRLSHPNLARVFHVAADGNRVFFAMQLLEGLSLRKILDLRSEKAQPFSIDEATPIVAQIAAALEDRERLPAHGDLKPENVLILPDLLKVSDFHLAGALPRAAFVGALRAAGAGAYLAPEVVEGAALTPAADVFALGTITAELLTGAVPAADFQLGAARPDLPERLGSVLRRALDPDPAIRPSHPEEIARALLELVTEGSAVARARMGTRAGRGNTPRPTAPPAAPAPIPSPVRDSEPFEPELPPFARDQTPPPQRREAGPPTAPAEPVPVAAAAPAEAPVPTSPSSLPAPSAPRPTPPPLPPMPPRVPEPPAPVAQATDESAEPTTVLPPGAPPPAILQPLRSSRPVPLPVWIALILAVIGGGTYGAIWYIDEQRTLEELSLLRDQEREQSALAAEHLRKQAPAAPALRAALAPAAPPTPAKLTEPPKPEPAAEEGEAKKEAEDEEPAARSKKRKEKRVAPRKEVPPKPPEPTLPKPEPPKETLVAAAGTELPAPEKKKKCPAGLVRVRAGAFRMGSAGDDPMRNFGERQLASVRTEEYCIDRYEYPNARGAMPLSGVTWTRAKELCEQKAKRLCAEEEWERACKGYQGLRFPYGDEFDEKKCNSESAAGENRAISRVGSFPGCKSGFGVFDLSGNVAEWTATPLSASSKARIIKGGSSNKPDWAVRCANRGNKPAGSRDAHLGFRCCGNPE